MSEAQIRAAAILLRKTLPDLSSTQLNGGDDGNPVTLHLIAAQLVSASLLEQMQMRGQTIVDTIAEPMPQNLLDAPTPTE